MQFYDEADFRPDQSIGYLVRRVHQLAGSGLEAMFAAEGLTGTQWSALIWIRVRRGATAAELARDLGHDKGAMTRLVDAVEERGWVVRERAPDDRRRINLALTDTGEAVAMRCQRRVIARWNDWLGDWREEDVRMLTALLAKLRGTLAEDAGA